MTSLGEENYRKAESGLKNDPNVRTIIAIGVGLSLDIETVENMLKLAGRSFKDTQEDRALKFCITSLSGQSIDDCNDFFEIGQQKINFSFFELSLPDDDPVYTLKKL